MHRALVLALVSACVTRHYVVDPRTEAGQRIVACMEHCSPSIFDECTDTCHVHVGSECGKVSPGLACKPAHKLHGALQGLLIAAVVLAAIGGAVGFLVAE